MCLFAVISRLAHTHTALSFRKGLCKSHELMHAHKKIDLHEYTDDASCVLMFVEYLSASYRIVPKEKKKSS